MALGASVAAGGPIPREAILVVVLLGVAGLAAEAASTTTGHDAEPILLLPATASIFIILIAAANDYHTAIENHQPKPQHDSHTRTHMPGNSEVNEIIDEVQREIRELLAEINIIKQDKTGGNKQRG